jgi:hypothetical protein
MDQLLDLCETLKQHAEFLFEVMCAFWEKHPGRSYSISKEFQWPRETEELLL